MTLKRRMLVFLLVTFLGVSAGIAGWEYAMAREPGVTLENFARLRYGMSIQQAHAILDSPDEEYGWRTSRVHVWKGNGLGVVLVFNEDGALQQGDKRFQDAGGNNFIQMGLHCDQSIFDKCRRMLGL